MLNFQQRDQESTVDADRQYQGRSQHKTKSHRNEIPGTLYEQGLNTLRTGTKTEVNGLLHPIVAELCVREVGLQASEADKLKKSELLQVLHNYVRCLRSITFMN